MRVLRMTLILLLVLAVPAQAWAECAGVLWTTLGDQAAQRGTTHLSAFTKAEDCHVALAAIVEGMKKKHGTEGWISSPSGSGSYNEPKRGRVQLNCLPDTIDPRGPKGGSR